MEIQHRRIIETVGGGPAIGADGTIYLGNLDGIVLCFES
jgi:outer membrane protein assembly factor BamB